MGREWVFLNLGILSFYRKDIVYIGIGVDKYVIMVLCRFVFLWKDIKGILV